MDHDEFRQWIARYEKAWRSAGTELRAELFAADAVYLHSPYARAAATEASGAATSAEITAATEVLLAQFAPDLA